MNFKGIGIGVLIFLIGIIALILEPYYYPNYSRVNEVFKTHLTTVEIPAGAEKIVMNFTITPENNSIIAFIVKGAGNITVLNGTAFHQVVNQGNKLGVILSPGNYYLAIINTQDAPQNITFTYGIFNAGYISGFYNGLNILTTVLEIIMLGGAAIAILSLAYQLLSRKKRSEPRY